MRGPFVGQLIACAGDFGAQATETDIKRWVENNGGRYSQSVEDNLNYLIVTEEAWTAKHSKIKQAIEKNEHRTKQSDHEIYIVHFDWLEDSTRYGRRLSAKKYGVKKILKEREALVKKKAAWQGQIVELRKTKRFIDEYKDLSTLGTHRVYRDSTDFEYEVTLTRINPDDDNQKEFYKLRLWESKAFPHLYACCVTYTKLKGQSGRQTLKPMGSWFWDSFDAFKEFFEVKTGKKWDNRLDGQLPGRGKFGYILPKLGWPVGQLPEGVFDSRMVEDAHFNDGEHLEDQQKPDGKGIGTSGVAQGEDNDSIQVMSTLQAQAVV